MNLSEDLSRIKELMGILNEETAGIDDFLNQAIKHYPKMKSFIDIVRSFIEKSNCKRIEVANFKYPASGMALHNGVLFNKNIFSSDMATFLYVVFHEIAHQYQYKKYGDDKMYQFYTDELPVSDAAKLMKEIELVADELAARKCRELKKLGHITQLPFTGGVYKNIPLSHFENLILECKRRLKDKNVKDFDQVADMFYNMVKTNT